MTARAWVFITAFCTSFYILITCDAVNSVAAVWYLCIIFTTCVTFISIFATSEAPIKFTGTLDASTFRVSTSCLFGKICYTWAQTARYVFTCSDEVLICQLGMRFFFTYNTIFTIRNSLCTWLASFCCLKESFFALASEVYGSSVLFENGILAKCTIAFSIFDTEEVFAAFGACSWVGTLQAIIQKCAGPTYS